MSANQIVTFDDPPVNEVALGRTFLPRPDFLLPYYGVFWERVRSRFPKAEHAPPLFDPAVSVDPSFLLPRVWLVAEDGATLLQLQQDRMHFNWRQTNEANAYVRFNRVQEGFLGAWGEFEKYVLEATEQPLQPTGAELSYINFISIDGVTSSVDLLEQSLRGFPNEWWGSPPLKPKQINLAHLYELPGGKTLKVSIVSAQKKDVKVPGLRLELTVSGKCPADAGFEEWSTSAHNHIVTAFRDMTTPAMHEKWRLRG